MPGECELKICLLGLCVSSGTSCLPGDPPAGKKPYRGKVLPYRGNGYLTSGAGQARMPEEKLGQSYQVSVQNERIPTPLQRQVDNLSIVVSHSAGHQDECTELSGQQRLFKTNGLKTQLQVQPAPLSTWCPSSASQPGRSGQGK